MGLAIICTVLWLITVVICMYVCVLASTDENHTAISSSTVTEFLANNSFDDLGVPPTSVSMT